MASVINTLAPKNITASDTAEVLISQEALGIQSLHLSAPSTNVGTVYLGDADVDDTRYLVKLEPGEEVDIEGIMENGTHGDIDTSSLYVYGTQDDDVVIGYMSRSN